MNAVILTGARGVGKTTLCLRLAASSANFAGVVSPAVTNASGVRVGYSMRCLGSGETWPLASAEKELDGPRFRRFSFSATGIARGLECVKESLSKPQGITVIDEIGPLELDKGEGLAPLLPVLAGSGDLLLVVREELVSRVVALVPGHETETLRLDAYNAEEVFRRAREVLLGEP